MNAVIDTNILIDYLNGVPLARQEINKYVRPSISTITWIEVLVGIPPAQEPAVRAFLATFKLQELDAPIKPPAPPKPNQIARRHRLGDGSRQQRSFGHSQQPRLRPLRPGRPHSLRNLSWRTQRRPERTLPFNFPAGLPMISLTMGNPSDGRALPC